MVLAWGNELAMRVLDDVLGIRAIVSVHGVLNALIVAPSLLLALWLGAGLDEPTRPSERLDVGAHGGGETR